ncbi:MAG: hypothetical protein JW966_05205 [Anaerolineae bacterium]|nr:hypothetical protein [Anaerolineae bacterium]
MFEDIFSRYPRHANFYGVLGPDKKADMEQVRALATEVVVIRVRLKPA